jgi:predicted HicB family RNase H-like nuclease
MHTMNYRGYIAKIDVDAAGEHWTGRLIGINDVAGFHADNVADLRTAFREAIDDYLATCEKIWKLPEKDRLKS